LGLEYVEPPSTKWPKGRLLTKSLGTGDVRGPRAHKRNLAEVTGEQILGATQARAHTAQNVKKEGSLQITAGNHIV
jgi:hypothetical protein